jgi:hypothetical protein
MELTPDEKKLLATSLKRAKAYGTEEEKKMNSDQVKTIYENIRSSSGKKREELVEAVKKMHMRRGLRGVKTDLSNIFQTLLRKEEEEKEELTPSSESEESDESDDLPPMFEEMTTKEQEQFEKDIRSKPVKKVQPRKLPMSGDGAGAGKSKPPPPPSSTIPPKPKQPAKAQTKSPIPPKPKQPASAQTKAPAQTISSSEESSSEESSSEDYTDDDFTDEEPTPMMEEPDPPQPPPQPPQPPPPPPLEEAVQAKVDVNVEKPKVSKITDELKEDPLLNPPSKQMGKSLDDLTVEEINKDLDYFYKTYGNRLKKLKRIKSKNIEVLKRFYKRVLALLRVDKDKEDKQIGIIIKGSEFIKNALKEIILENSIDGLTAKDLLINIEGDEDKDKADAGKYEFKTNPSTGKKYAQGEPVDRLIPTQDPKQVAEVHSDHTASSYKKKPSRLQMPKTMFRSDVVTARKMVNSNPFLNSRQPSIKLRTVY